MSDLRGPGRAMFAAVLLLIGGVLNMIYGIAAISNSHVFTAHAHYVFSSLHGWGWINLIIGVIELLAAFSLFGGGGFGRWIGIIAGSLAALAALLSLPAYPFWGLAIFALSLYIIHGLTRRDESFTDQGTFTALETGEQRPSNPM
jgi:hypothetical protein